MEYPFPAGSRINRDDEEFYAAPPVQLGERNGLTGFIVLSAHLTSENSLYVFDQRRGITHVRWVRTASPTGGSCPALAAVPEG